MTRHEKKRILEQDMDSLIEDFLKVRLEQLTASDLESLKLERRADSILTAINQKRSDIASLFPEDQPPPPPQPHPFRRSLMNAV